ncbi:MAG: hypothetical protein U0610_30095 [bacterium]
MATSADATPIGGTYLDFFYPVMNLSRRPAFYADVRAPRRQLRGRLVRRQQGCDPQGGVVLRPAGGR